MLVFRMLKSAFLTLMLLLTLSLSGVRLAQVYAPEQANATAQKVVAALADSELEFAQKFTRVLEGINSVPGHGAGQSAAAGGRSLKALHTRTRQEQQARDAQQIIEGRGSKRLAPKSGNSTSFKPKFGTPTAQRKVIRVGD